MANKFFGEVFGGISKAVLFPVALANGVKNVINGDNFENGIDDVYDNCKSTIQDIEHFGDKHHDTIKDVAKTTASIVIATAVGAKITGKK